MLDPEKDYNHTKFERPPWNSVRQRAKRKVFDKSENMSIISLEYTQIWKIVYIHYPLHLLNNPTKFQLNRIRTQDFQLKLFDSAVTLKYSQGHKKWYDQVKLNE